MDPSLKRVWNERNWFDGMGFYMESHHSQESEQPTSPLEPGHAYIDLCAPIEQGGRKFLPIVRETFLLTCSLKVLFLRRGPPGRVYEGGDLDNRLKTLFDALSVPAHPEQVMADEEAPDVMYTLLEDDSAITKIDIETHRLLSRPEANSHEVRLIIEAEVRVAHPRTYNQPFLGS